VIPLHFSSTWCRCTKEVHIERPSNAVALGWWLACLRRDCRRSGALAIQRESLVGIFALVLAVSLSAADLNDGGLSAKYGSASKVLHGSSELFRLTATYSPLPLYPASTLRTGRQGLVVIELAVSDRGRRKPGRKQSVVSEYRARERRFWR